MAILTLNKNNKNEFRRYPLKKEATFTSAQKITLPDDFIVNCSITSIFGKHRIYIRQISLNAEILNIVIASYFSDEVLGIFSGSVTSDYTVLQLSAVLPYISGNIVLGKITGLSLINRVLYFEKETTEFEESVIFCHKPPAVTSIADKKNIKISGDVKFGTLSNIQKTIENNTIKFATVYIDSIFNNADRSSHFNNCPTPIIKNINSVTPSVTGVGNPENDGNIYIAGVAPIKFLGIPEINNSLSTLTIGLGEKTLQLNQNLAFPVGQIVYIYSSANNQKYMQAKVVNYNPSTGILVVTVTSISGTGETYSSWLVKNSSAGVIKTETEDITLANLCDKKQKSLPPTQIYGFTTIGNIDKYYNKSALPAVAANPSDLLYPLARPARLAGNFNSALRPEYYFWPQFVRQEYYDFWPSP